MILSYRRTLLAAVFALMMAAPAGAHELLIKPPSDGAHGLVEVEVSDGDIDKSFTAIDWSSVSNVTVAHNGGTQSVDASAWRVDGMTAKLRVNVDQPSTYLLGVSTNARHFEMSRSEFLDYVKKERIEVSAKEATKETLVERYSKYAISYLQSGNRLTSDFKRQLDFPMQIRMIEHPSALRVGDTVHLRVIYRGKPLAGQLVLGGNSETPRDAKGEPVNTLSLRTNQRGVASFKINEPGRWYAFLVHMRPVSDGDADYESLYATTLLDVAK